MLTLLILALLSWTCGQTSVAKEVPNPNHQPPQIAVGYDALSEALATAPKAAQKEEVGKVPSPKTTEPSLYPVGSTAKDIRQSEEASTPKEEVVVEVGAVEDTVLQDNTANGEHTIEDLAGVDHTSFSGLLQKYVDGSGKVNYLGLKNEIDILDLYLTLLKERPVQEGWSRNEKLAYWINAYNAFTIKLILNNYPVGSITDLEGGKPWDKKWIDLGDKIYSLNQIENDIIRPQFQEPRIHFAVNCAAKSCPPLANKAYTSANLETLLESQTKKFINDTKHNKLTSSQVQVSKIFDWYGVDFGNVIEFLNKYASIQLDANAKLEFLEYNWSLNN